jgi:hypothetical protein
MSFLSKAKALRAAQNKFDAAARLTQRALLDELRALPLPGSAVLADYHDSLLFMAAHPGDAALSALVEKEFKRIERFLKVFRGNRPSAWEDRGLPWAPIITRFSHDALRWLSTHPHARLELDSLQEGSADLNAIFALTLPTLERSETTADRSTDELLAALRVKPTDALKMVLQELARLDHLPLIKDHLLNQLELFVRIVPTSTQFSKARNRLLMPGPVFQTDSIRRFDVQALINTPLPPARKLNAAQRDEAVRVLRNTMALTIRETDPITYIDAGSLRIHDLERGVSCATFGMSPDRQLPLESYVGFVLFKNGLPVSYGGSWVFGRRAAFGMNIFEPYRGGESGYLMTQVLRTYSQRFSVRSFEVDAGQFGLDNPDGIKSGAYWFYHRHGFRSIDKALRKLAEQEKARIDARPGYRSSEKTLIAFTFSNVALNLDAGSLVPAQPDAFVAAVTQWIAKHHRGDRAEAQRQALLAWSRKAEAPSRDAKVRAAQIEWALVACALDVKSDAAWALMARASRLKPIDVDRYQGRVSELLTVLR